MFKTSETAAHIALKINTNTEEGKDSTMAEEHAYLDGMHSRA